MSILDSSVVDNLVLQVRQAADESNTSDLTDDEILRAMNRAQKRLVRIATRRHPPFFKRERTFTAAEFSGRELTLPDAAFGLIVNELHAIIGGVAYEVLPATSRQTALVESNAQSTVANYYSIIGDKLNVYPTPNGTTEYRMRYQIRPPELAVQQGRITDLTDYATGIMYVDDIGSDLTTSVTDLKAFINVIDSTTGLVKATLQISALDTTTNKITVKLASLNRSTVFGLTVAAAIPTTVALDDYVCLAYGTCIPPLIRDYDDFIIAYTVLEIKRRMGEDTTAEYAHFKETEADIEKMWSGRPSTGRIARRNAHWGRSSFSGFFRY